MADLIPYDARDGYIWLNGEMVAWRDANLHVLSHGLHYGSCVFEGERAYGGKVFKLTEHSQRLIDSGRILGFKVPYTAAELDAVGHRSAVAGEPGIDRRSAGEEAGVEHEGEGQVDRGEDRGAAPDRALLPAEGRPVVAGHAPGFAREGGDRAAENAAGGAAEDEGAGQGEHRQAASGCHVESPAALRASAQRPTSKSTNGPYSTARVQGDSCQEAGVTPS